jgi:hypothetical protein
VNTGNGLHQASITITQPAAIDGFGLRNIGAAVLAQRNFFLICCQNAGHAVRPNQLIAYVFLHKDMNVAEFLEDALGIGVNAGDKLELSL